MLRVLRFVPLVVAVLAGCASEYRYQPSANATASIRGRSAADYRIPETAPAGDLRLASFGFSRVSPANGMPSERVLHLRMIVANDSGQPWRLDTRQQLLDIHGAGKFGPAFASSKQGAADLPMIEVAPGDSRTVDLFYRLPAGMNDARHVADFDAITRVDTPRQQVIERTPFERLQVIPEYAYGYGPYGYGGYDWGPFWYPDAWASGAYVGWPSW